MLSIKRQGKQAKVILLLIAQAGIMPFFVGDIGDLLCQSGKWAWKLLQDEQFQSACGFY